jgi:hypothetical protein
MVSPLPAVDTSEQGVTTEEVERTVVWNFPARKSRPLRVIDITTKDARGNKIAVTELHMLGDFLED